MGIYAMTVQRARFHEPHQIKMALWVLLYCRCSVKNCYCTYLSFTVGNEGNLESERSCPHHKKIKTCQLLILCENVECSAWLNVGTRQDGEEQAPKCILATSACFSIRWRPRLTTVRGATAASAPASGSVLLDPARDRCHWRPPPRPGPRSAVPFQPNRALVLLPRTIQLHQGRDETHLVVAGTQKPDARYNLEARVLQVGCWPRYDGHTGRLVFSQRLPSSLGSW